MVVPNSKGQSSSVDLCSENKISYRVRKTIFNSGASMIQTERKVKIHTLTVKFKHSFLAVIQLLKYSEIRPK
jgi:hypothetical protein